MWDKARALFEAGKSFREIEKETGLNYKTVERKSKSDDWIRGILSQRIEDMARVKADFVTLDVSQQLVVTTESDKLANFIIRSEKIGNLAYDRIEAEIKSCEVQHIKSLVEAADKVKVMVGAAPRFNPVASTQISNTNQVVQPVQIIVEGV